jgi:hypothetical protein
VGDASEEVTWWTDDLTLVLRSVLHFHPFHLLKLNDGLRQSDEMRHYNALTIAVKILDAILENSGLESEHDRDSLTDAVTPVLTSMDAAAGVEPDSERHHRIVLHVLKLLRNDADQRRPFKVNFVRFDSHGNAVEVPLPVWLVRDAPHPTKRVIYELSPQAKNIFFGALELDIENQQVATQALLEYQLRKGKLEEARHLAERAERLSREYSARIRQIIHDAERDLDKVEWETEVPRVLTGAIEHLKLRLPVESSLIEQVETRLAEATVESQAQSLAAVRERLEACQHRHVSLHQVLIGVEKVFLDAQRRQKFNPRPPKFYPDLFADVLVPTLRASVATVESEATPGVAYLLPARTPRVFSLTELVDWQLRPKRDAPPPDRVVLDPELQDIEQAMARYPKDIRDRAAHILTTQPAGTTLSDVLVAAEAQGVTAEVLEVIHYTFLHYFAPEPEERAPFRVERVKGKTIRSAHFYGDELQMVTPGGAQHE